MPAPDYSNALGTDGRDLVALAKKGEIEPVDFRAKEIEAFISAIDRGESVLLVGEPGAGKSTILRGAALELHRRGHGGLVETTTVAALSGTHYLGDWQSKIMSLARSAIKASTVLVFGDIVNLVTAGVSSQQDASMLDALRPLIESRELVLVGEVTPEALRLIERTPHFADLFKKIAVAPLDESAVGAVLERAAKRAGLGLDAAALDTLVQLTTRFLPARPQPGPALALLHQVSHYLQEKEHVGERAPVDRAFIERVFSIYSGLPPFIISRDVTMPVNELRAWFRERLVGQEEAIESVVETIALFKAGLHDTSKPIGSFLFVGPTGVGKTELARALATFLFGSPQRMLRFDMSEFKDYNSFEILLGDPKNPEKPAALLDPVRVQPFQLVLLDELEKAHSNVWDLLLPLIDEGRLTPPGREAINFRSTIVICTSNVGAQHAQIRSVGFGDEQEDKSDRIRESLELHFRPEFLNRFQHIAIFHPLSRKQVHQIARKELARILQREGIVSRHLAVEVDEPALDLVVARGFDARYGARALKREIQSLLVMPIAMALMEKTVEPGQIVRITDRQGRIQVQLLDTSESRESRREKEPIRSIGRKWTREDVLKSIADLHNRIEGVSGRADEETLRSELDRLTRLRAEHTFWRAGEETARALQGLEFNQAALDRLAKLRGDVEALSEQGEKAHQRTVLGPLVHQLAQLEAAVELAELELVYMGREERWDALVEIRPLGESGRTARDTLVQVYGDWARDRGFTFELLREPVDPDEPALLSVVGEYAYGFLHHELGLHRVVLPKLNSVARVQVVPWTERRGPVGFREEHALKRVGAYGGKVRSRVECDGGLVLQNKRSLAENRELAIELVGSWLQAPGAVDDVVRRYEPQTPLVRDILCDTNSGHPEALRPDRFHDLLCQRVQLIWKQRQQRPPPAA
jgi:ATP-dependent Clp protease ATP-binding subunit ClpC